MSTAKKKKTTTTTTSTAPSLDESLPVLASEKTPYTYVNYAGLIDDKPVYVVGQGRDKMFIYFDGKELGKSYGSAGSPRSVGGRLAYVAQNKSKYFLVLDGAEGNKYDYVEPPVDVGGKPAYIATKGTRKYAVYDGKEYGDGYDNVESFVAGIVGNLCFAGLKDRKDHLVCGGKEVGGGFNSIASPYAAEYDGKLLYVGQNDSTKYVIYDGNLVGNGYHDVVPPFVSINGKLTFMVEDETTQADGTKTEKYYIVYDGKETGKGYDTVQQLYPGATEADKASFIEVGGKIAYVGILEGGMFIALDQKKVGDTYDRVRDLAAVNGVLAFTATNNQGQDNFVLYGSEVVSQGFNDVFSLRAAGDRVVYIVWDPNQMKYFLMSGSTKASDGFDKIQDNEVYVVDGKVLFIGEKEGEWYIVREK